MDDIYDQLEELVDAQNGKDYMVIMGDWNAIVGEKRDGSKIGDFDLGNRNER